MGATCYTATIFEKGTFMTDSELLNAVGEAMYGTGWKIQVAELLSVDRRRINHWLAGDRPIPDGIWGELSAEINKRQDELTTAEKILKNRLNNT